MSTKVQKRLKIGAIAALFLVSLAVAQPSIFSFAPSIQKNLETLEVNLGLDLQGGAHLEYEAITEGLDPSEVASALDAVQGVVERRVNAIGVGEPRVAQAQSGSSHRIIVEIPGVEDVNSAKDRIQGTPVLEFREYNPENEAAKSLIDQFNARAKTQAQETLDDLLSGEKDFEDTARAFSQDPGSAENGGDLNFTRQGKFVPEFDAILFDDAISFGKIYPNVVESQFGYHIIRKDEERWVNEETGEVLGGSGEGIAREVRASHILFGKTSADAIPELAYTETGLTGKYLERATADFHGQQYGLGDPVVSIQFDAEGTKLFEDITERNIGKPLAIFIDGEMISDPIVNEKIAGGQAVISGNFTAEETKDLARRLNEGALPVPLKLVAEGSRSASLGEEDFAKSIQAGMIGLGLVMLYMILYYRFLGIVAACTLFLYMLMIVSIFKLSGLAGSQFYITLTLSGVAGFILSIGMAVDANILIFERVREEIRSGKGMLQSFKEGFKRAWTSIRDGNSSTILTAFILISIGSGFVQGFALVLVLGIVVSMFTAMVITKAILLMLPMGSLERNKWLIR